VVQQVTDDAVVLQVEAETVTVPFALIDKGHVVPPAEVAAGRRCGLQPTPPANEVN